MNIGVALFINKNNPRAGFGSMNGGEPFEFETIGDLSSDCLWITNLNYNELRKVNLCINTKIRRNDFLRVSLERIASDLGVNIDTSAHTACRILSEIATRTIRAARNLYQIDRFGFSLKDSIQSVISNDLSVETDNSNITNAINESYQNYQRCFGKPPANAGFYSLRINRQKYGLFIQDRLIPSGGWRILKDGRFPISNTVIKSGKESNCYKFLMKAIDKKACLVEIIVKNIDKNVANLLDHGNGTNQRDWIPAHEAALIAKYGNITIKSVIYAQGYTKIPPEHAAKLIALDGTQSTSYSFGIIADNHIAALKAKSYNPKLERQQYASSRASWLSAWDRVLLFKYAERLQVEGFFVSGFGSGTIHVLCEEDRIARLNNVSDTLGLSKPMNLPLSNPLSDSEISTSHFYNVIYGDL